jgi:hypothetical protein
MALFFDMFKRTVSLLRSSQTFKQSHHPMPDICLLTVSLLTSHFYLSRVSGVLVFGSVIPSRLESSARGPEPDPGSAGFPL